MENQAFSSLIQDHAKVRHIIDELLETKPTAKQTRQQLLTTLKHELQTHEALEENIVYASLKDKRPTRELAQEAYQEHHVVDVLLEELESLDFRDEAWKAKLTVLQENLLHHIQEEEEQLFPQAEKTLSAKELDKLGQRIDDARKA